MENVREFVGAFEAFWRMPSLDELDGILSHDLVLRQPLGGRPIEWPVVDRFVLHDGLATERVSYFDPTPLLRAVLTRPTSWWRLVRSRS